MKVVTLKEKNCLMSGWSLHLASEQHRATSQQYRAKVSGHTPLRFSWKSVLSTALL